MPRKQNGGLVGLLGKGVGLASEYREHRKELNTQRQNSSTSPRGSNSYRSGQPHPASAASEDETEDLPLGSSRRGGRKCETNARSEEDEGDHYDDLSTEEDQELWALDDAGHSGPLENQDVVSHDQLIHRVLQSDVLGLPRTPLPLPVIIPQRRPGNKNRGFVRAYAPLLGECSGISQTTFLTFLDNFDASSQASPVFTYVQVAAGIAGMVHEPIAMMVTMAVQAGAQAGKAMQENARANSFLDKMNETLFKPHGLYAMVVKYISQAQAQVQARGNTRSAKFGVLLGQGTQRDFDAVQAIAKYEQGGQPASGLNSIAAKFRGFSGSTYGAMMLPASAPLIFPAVDHAVELHGPETFKDKTRDMKQCLASYMDRRAQQKYAQNDPESSLVLPEEQRGFKSKYSDPNHPMFNNGLKGLLSGGKLAGGIGGNGYQGLQQGGTNAYNRRANINARINYDGGFSRREQRRENRRGGSRNGRRRQFQGEQWQHMDKDHRFLGRDQDQHQDYVSRGNQNMDGQYGSGRRQRVRRDGSGDILGRVDAMEDAGAIGRGDRGQVGRLLGGNGLIGTAMSRGRNQTNDHNKQQSRDFDEGNCDDVAPSFHRGQGHGNGGRRSGRRRNGGYGDGFGGDTGARVRGRNGVKRPVKMNVFYLTIVNLPSEAELAESRRLIA